MGRVQKVFSIFAPLKEKDLYYAFLWTYIMKRTFVSAAPKEYSLSFTNLEKRLACRVIAHRNQMVVPLQTLV